MPDPWRPFNRVTISDSQGIPIGPDGFGGAGCAALGGSPGVGLGRAPGSPGFCAGTGSTLGGVGLPWGDLDSPVAGGAGDLVSSDIAAKVPASDAQDYKNNQKRTITSNSLVWPCQRSRGCSVRPSLIALDQVTNAQSIAFAVTMTKDRIGASARLNPDIRPDHPGRDMHGRDLAYSDTLLVPPEQAPSHPRHSLRRDHNFSGEK